MEIIFLGTGTSHGVPLIGCNCKTCSSDNKRNKRNRSAILIKQEDGAVLIDTPQELRLMLLRENIKNFDAVFYTHPHADHLLGFDDIRSINRLTGKTIPCYGNNYTINEIKRVFPYIFDAVQKGGGLPEVKFNILSKPVEIASFTVTPLPVKHGKLDILGYKIAKIAYITDCSYIPDSTIELIKDVELLILGALRYRKHETHMNIDEAVEVVSKLKIPRAYFTHLSHDLEYTETMKYLPDNIKLAYDGLHIEL